MGGGWATKGLASSNQFLKINKDGREVRCSIMLGDLNINLELLPQQLMPADHL